MRKSDMPLIRLDKICKAFGSKKVNQDICLDINAGKIKALLGENGAGKSTLMSMLAGKQQPDSGRIIFNGEPVKFSSPKEAIDAGIGMVYQHFMLVEAMTVAENVFLGQPQKFWVNPKKKEKQVAELAERFGLDIDPAAMVADLSMGEKQRVEILKLLQRQSNILIFDEPTAVLTPQESVQLFAAFRQMKAQGKSILFISHKLDEVMEISDEVAVLRKGVMVDQMLTSEVSSGEELAERMVGREVILAVDKPKVEIQETVLNIKNLVNEKLAGVDLELKKGEILGIVGVAGNGQKALVETVCGINSPAQGEVSIIGKPWKTFYSPLNRKHQLGYIAEDRKGLATIPELDLLDNFLLTTRKDFCSGPWLKRKQAREEAQVVIEEFGVQPPDLTMKARQFSGGNLQKLVLGREFFQEPPLIVAEQPTQGLDIAATEGVWKQLIKARKTAGILLVTGDLTEALSISDRIAVMFEGKIVDSFSVNDTKKVEQIGMMMAGGTAA